MSDFAKKHITATLMLIAEIVVMLITGVLIGSLIIPIAYAERNTLAFGGEWLLIIAISLLAAYGFDRFVAVSLKEVGHNEKQ